MTYGILPDKNEFYAAYILTVGNKDFNMELNPNDWAVLSDYVLDIKKDVGLELKGQKAYKRKINLSSPELYKLLEMIVKDMGRVGSEFEDEDRIRAEGIASSILEILGFEWI